MQPRKYFKRANIISSKLFLLGYFFILFAFRVNSQDLYTTVALTAADNTGYGYYTFQKPGLYFSIGKSQEVERLREGRFSYGVAFSQKGARKAPNPSNLDFVEYNVRLNYAEVNMLFWLKMKSLKALVGLNGGYLFNKTEKSANGIPVIFSSGYRKLDFSFTAGLGVMLGKNFLLQMTGSYSIIPVIDVGGLGRVAFSRGPRNTLVNIGFTYLFIKKPEPEENSVEE